MWFSNHTRSGNVSKSRTKLLVLQKKKQKKLQPTQAYSRLFYEGKLKAIVEQRWTAHIALEPEDATKNKKPTLQFRNKVIKELYDAEPTEIKKEVEAYRDTFLVDEMKVEDEDDPLIDKEEAQRRAKAIAMQR
jgi:hypothetical protein